MARSALRHLAVGTAVALAPVSSAPAQELFDLRPVAPNVYFAYAKPEFFPISANCNAVVVLLDDGVLVVDTHSRRSAAKDLIALIRK